VAADTALHSLASCASRVQGDLTRVDDCGLWSRRLWFGGCGFTPILGFDFNTRRESYIGIHDVLSKCVCVFRFLACANSQQSTRLLRCLA